MKRAIYILIIITLFSCQGERRNDKLEIKEPLFNETETSAVQKPPEVVAPVKKIETLIDVESEYPELQAVEKRDLNLDRDTSVEQLIILKNNSGLVTLSIADYNGATKSYTKAWDVNLPVLYNDDFSLTEQDILGIQQDLQIVVSGSTLDKSNTLYIFQKSAPPRGLQIYYKEIFGAINQGRIEIEEKERDLDYVEKKKNQGKSYDIILEKTKMLNDNTLSITTETWVWDRRRRLFIKSNINTEEIKINAKERLTTIYRGSKTDFLEFLSGEWYLIDEEEDIDKILIFDSKNDTVQFSYKDGIENFSIQRYYHYYRQLDIRLRNREVNTLPARIVLTLDNTDEITLGDKSNSKWKGKYRRLTSDLKNSLISETNLGIKIESPFTGVYKNVLYSINFTYPEYKKLSPSQGLIEEGIFNILKLSNGTQILQMKSRENVVNNYLLKYDDQILESQIIRTIRIHQGKLTNYGIELFPDMDLIKFEQTEVLSNE